MYSCLVGEREMIELILQLLYFMLPAAGANMAPVIFRKFLPLFDKPVDFKRLFRGKRIFGAHKSWGGIVFGTLFGILICFIQFYIQYREIYSLFFVDYTYWYVIGFLLSFGALFGDLMKSFFKRQIGIKPGKRFIPFDQIDFSLGALALFSIYQLLPFLYWILIIVGAFFLHITVNHISFFLKIRNEKW
jgi:CDP-2,3-bis-(O-geranylgeranyl)-sn-glycerol synthase